MPSNNIGILIDKFSDEHVTVYQMQFMNLAPVWSPYLTLTYHMYSLLQNLVQNPRTLLPKFYGLYTYQSGGKNIRFVVMNNLLPSNLTMHQKFDLKVGHI